MDSPAPLPSGHLERLRSLTRAYARLSRRGAGLGKVLAGAFLLAVAAVEVLGHGGRFTWLGAFAPLPAGPALATAPLPFLWLLAREGLGRCWEARYGAVSAAPEAPGRRQRMGRALMRFLLPALMLLGLIPLLAGELPLGWVRGAAVLVLALGLSVLGPRLRDPGRLERMACVLLFLGPALLLCGIQMAAGDTLLAFPVLGLAAIGTGLGEHVAFLRLRRELGEAS